MTPEKRKTTIEWLKEEIRSLHLAPKINGCGPENWADLLEIMETCLEAVRGYGTEPLTIEQLREMDRPTPVWAEVDGKTIEGWDGYWCLCHRGKVLAPGRILMNADSAEGVTFYAYQPAHIDREAWEPCWTCRSVKSEPSWGKKYKYCPRCGRPLTEKAWAMLEKRLRG